MATLRVICFSLLATGLLASSAYAQNATKPLNLNVPPSSGFPVASAASTASASTASANPAPASTPPANASAAPGAYYGDTNAARITGVAANNPNAAADSCDDGTNNKAQVHGSVTTGVVAGNDGSGSYQAGTVNITKPLGDCDHPTGALSISFSGGQSRFNYPHRYH